MWGRGGCGVGLGVGKEWVWGSGVCGVGCGEGMGVG